VKPAPFEYVAPRDIEETLALLARHGGDAKLLAGGQSRVPMMNLRLARPAFVCWRPPGSTRTPAASRHGSGSSQPPASTSTG
jgi:hypothetical protein